MEPENLAEPPSRSRSELQLEVIEQLKLTPIVSAALKRAGVSRATFYRWLKINKHFKGIAEAARGMAVTQVNDMCEAQLIAMAKDKSLPAIRYWLDNHHNDYVKVKNRAFPGVPDQIIILDTDTLLVDEDRDEILKFLEESDRKDEAEAENKEHDKATE